jgi:hypothetical protein
MTILVVGVLGLFVVRRSRRPSSDRRSPTAARARRNDAVRRLRSNSLVTRAGVRRAAEAGPATDRRSRCASVAESRDLPTYVSTTSPFLDVNQDGLLDVVVANAGSPGLLPVEMTVGTGADPLVVEALVLHR